MLYGCQELVSALKEFLEKSPAIAGMPAPGGDVDKLPAIEGMPAPGGDVDKSPALECKPAQPAHGGDFITGLSSISPAVRKALFRTTRFITDILLHNPAFKVLHGFEDILKQLHDMAGFQDIPEGELLFKLSGHKSMQDTNFDLEAGTPYGRSIFYKSNIYRSFLDDRAEFFLSRAAKEDDEEKSCTTCAWWWTLQGARELEWMQGRS